MTVYVIEVNRRGIIAFHAGDRGAAERASKEPSCRRRPTNTTDPRADLNMSKGQGRQQARSRDRSGPVAYFTARLVAFTGVLAISTIGLWIVQASHDRRVCATLLDCVGLPKRQGE